MRLIVVSLDKKGVGKQIGRHLSKKQCEKLTKKIIGCGKPFELTRVDQHVYVRVCDYL